MLPIHVEVLIIGAIGVHGSVRRKGAESWLTRGNMVGCPKAPGGRKGSSPGRSNIPAGGTGIPGNPCTAGGGMAGGSIPGVSKPEASGCGNPGLRGTVLKLPFISGWVKGSGGDSG